MYADLQELPKKHKVMALVRMESIRASQILPLRKKLRDSVSFFSIKDKVARKALAKTDVPGMDKMMDQLTGQCMFMFTDISPFTLNVLLKKNKTMMAARAGDIASIDVTVPAKNTGIAPGPMLTEFKEAGIPTKIDQGTIWILKDTTPVKKGEPIGDKLAPLLGKLDIKPVEAVIALESALEEGVIYSREDLAVDVEAIRAGFAQAHQEALSLSVEAAYVTPENVGQVLARAAQHARSLSVESAFMTDETSEQIIQKADASARSLASKAKGYTPA
ncbi:ribosomal protein L10 [Cenarchaeum symbiosum A]|uniref:Large ribosomal subunit protein uL10 n=1 Tax=Cenarchaeum symbiosum (strain A) TaxID=414004 RepID=A0RX06_CENSY|nr:ribosomal protein L10 [Cenarchaeum symbiosum A]